MRTWPPSLVLALGLASASSAADPRAVVERAIGVAGADKLIAAKGIYRRISGVAHEADGAHFSGDFYYESPDREKTTLLAEFTGELAGEKTTISVGFDRGKGWSFTGGADEGNDPYTLADLRAECYVSYLTTLVPLLNDKSLRLEDAGESKIRGRLADRVRVVAEGRQTVLLYFDRQTGFLTKTEDRRRNGVSKEPMVNAQYFEDYRAVDFGAAEEKILKAANLSPAPAALLAYLRDHTPNDAKRRRLQELVRSLGDVSFDVREKAQAELISAGPAAAPLLGRAADDPDPEVATRAKACLARLGKKPDTAVPAAVVRLLAIRHPEGAVEALLAYYPGAPDEATARNVYAALVALIRSSAQPHPALMNASKDADPHRRELAERLASSNADPSQAPPGLRLFVTGVKQPMRGSQCRAGKKVYEWQVDEVAFYNRFDDSVFTKPAGMAPPGR